MTDGITWLAEPEAIAWSGYGIVIARDLDGESLARRVAQTALRKKGRPRFIGELTGRQVQDVLEGVFEDVSKEVALRHGELDEWSYVVKYGGWQGEFGDTPPVDRHELHVFHLEFDEWNGKPVPPWFAYRHDERLMCKFNLHLDAGWSWGSPDGDPEVAAAVRDRLTAAGLPDEDLDRRTVHRTSLRVLQEHFGLTLPRGQIVQGTLPTLLLTGP
ncbi:hypothetical protein K4B79_30585 [Streptomyces lincolnensis]|uniref:hypothetical protein n=1 Tax=Streptomyces lincolnensis TaxID=1915 RepID=UPI001E415804|nr:hypothetical protein [Streptomyces lincolnensis]MCD7442554.1 hypothetical protein [Streptomyces lincolnensis]